MNDLKDTVAISLFSEVLAADQVVRHRLSRELPKGMEISHFSVLNHLAWHGGERTPAQLAEVFGLTRGAMTNTLGKLEAAGYVHIRPDWDDARRKLVAISPAGQRVRDEAAQAAAPVFAEVVQQIGAEDIRTAIRVLRALRTGV